MYEMQRKAEETEDTSKLSAIYDHGLDPKKAKNSARKEISETLDKIGIWMVH